MVELKKVVDKYKDDMQQTVIWCESVYNEHFAKHFCGIKDIFDRLKSKTNPITDSELEWTLTVLPMELFAVAETLNNFRLSLEVLKLNTKKKRKELAASCTEKSAAAKNEFALCQTVEEEVLMNMLGTIVQRVENEIAFSKELIMGAKKVWDSRRKADNSNPVSEVELPNYTPKLYIK